MKHARQFLLMAATLLCGFSVKAQITAVSQLDNDSVYFVSQTYHAEGATSWAIAYGGTALQTNVELGIESDEADPRQQFSFITNDGGTTYYLYHPAEGKYVNRDGSLSVTPQHQIYFKAGMFDATFVVYFGSSYYINVNGERKVVIDSWAIPDKGNSCQIIPTSKGETTDTEADVSTLFVNADFETGNTTGWTVSRPSNATNFGPANTAAKYGYQGTYFMEAWGRRANLGDFEWSQTQAVPNGTYVVTALAHAKYENDEYRIPQGVYVFAEDQQAAVTTITPSEYVLIVEVTDGKLTIGYRGVSCNVNWAASDDFRVSKPDLDAEYTVTFYDWDGTVLKTEKVKWGKSATAPADPERDGYTFAGWDKAFVSVISDLDIHASYTRNVADVTTLFVNTDFEDGTTGWTISGPENANTGTIGTAAGHSYQGTYFMEAWRSAEAGTLGNFEWSQTQTVPNGTYVVTALAHNKKENDASVTPQGTYIFANDQQVAITTVVASEYTVTVEVTDGTLTIGYRGVGCNGNWAACDHFRIGQIDTGAEYTVTFYDWDGTELKTEAVKWGKSATAPADPERLGYTFSGWDKDFSSVITDLDIHANYARNVGETYLISLPYHQNGATSWAIDTDGTTLISSTTLGVAPDTADPRQQFVFIRNSEGGYNLYHPASKKYVNKDCSLSDTPVDVIYLIGGAYPDTYIAYFDQTHYVNVNGNSYLVINSFSTPGEGNSFLIVPANAPENEDVGAEYTVTFYDWDGTLLKTEVLRWGQSATAPANPVRDGYVFVDWDINYKKVYADLVVYATYSMIDDILPEAAPRAELWYDFEGVGEKGFVKDHYDYNNFFDVAFTAGISQQFKTIKSYSGSDELYWGATCYIEDLNRDGVVDISTAGANSLLSQGGEFEYNEGMLIVPNFDINNDGRLDYLKSKGNNSWSIMVRQADGSFVEQFMQVMTEEEYESTFDPENWKSTTTQKSAFTGVVAVGGWSSSVRFSGVSLASAPPRREANAPQMRAQGMNPTVGAPTRALDLNADGYVDLIDEKNGVLYYNVGEGRWVTSYLGGSVMVADLNGDHIQDFIFPGQELWVAVYRGANDFEIQTLYENIQVDREMYCYDFDRDGDVDILVTFSAPLNSTGYAYTMFFDNDGTGKFTQLDEQDYGSNNLLFSNCQDLDGDGYYDLLAFRGDFDGYTNRDIVWLKGQPGKTFAQPESLVTLADSYTDVYSAKISVEDINNDGRMDVWADVDGVPAYSFAGASNTAPTAPAKPNLFYSNGVLAINWGDGSDEQTATSDLTYALRVGTTPGGDDILHAHANADGSRRNFLDGNMSKYQNYTLDLRSYQPGTIYVSVQTIDAQHTGSAWSEEATVEHTGFFADFRMSKNELGRGEKITAIAPAMPDGFTHTWIAEDGTCTGDGHEVEIVFHAAGEKTITHTLTAADGTSMSTVEMVNVLPNYIDVYNDYIMTDRNNTFYENGKDYSGVGGLGSFADYNMDGYWDKLYYDRYTSTSTSGSVVVLKGGEGYSYTQAAGVWNTGLEAYYDNRRFWYDWDHNGAADLLFSGTGDGEEYWLPHNGTSNMKARQLDGNLELFLDHSMKNPFIDYTHDGNYELLYLYTSKNGARNVYMYTRQDDGSYQQQDIKGNVYSEDLYTILNNFGHLNEGAQRAIDINHDGFVDICGFTSSPVKEMTVMVNKGNCEFEKLTIPFEMAITTDDFPNTDCLIADMNNDGYYDLINRRRWGGNDGAIYVMWNEKNQRFAAPEVLPLGELESFDTDRWAPFNTVDLDNNGYLDIVGYQQDKSLGNAGWGLYVYYFGPDGIIQQGFVAQGEYFSSLDNTLFKLPNHPWTLIGYDVLGFDDVETGGMWPERYCNYCYFPIHTPENERPSAPTGVRAVQTAKGLLIEWNDAKDDATTGKQMRYNLSVKKKGASGEGAYLISPQNACNSNAAPVRDFNYITATQYLIPTTVLPQGEYEIQLQAIDLQGDWSVFTEPLSVLVEEMYVIDAPTLVCSGDLATFTYMGSPSADTPVWDFDGATVKSGSGYGPYVLWWGTDTPVTKTVTLTVDGKVTKHMIHVDTNEAELELPRTLINNTTATLDIPEGVDVMWSMMPKENGTEYKSIFEYPEVLKIEGNKLILENTSGIKDWYISARMYNGNGCERVLTFGRKIYEQADLPQITVVTADAEGHNVIDWRMGSFSGKVRILKETNRRDQYVEIGVVEGYDYPYIDRSANASMQGERYAIQLIPDEDIEGTIPTSTPHTTSHLTINRGLTDTMWNLIWSDYEGGSVVGYNILRGTSPDNLVEIGSVSASHHSYTDYAPDANAPYYAIEYILDDGTSYAPGMNRAAARATGLKGQTNVVNSNMANTLIYAEKVSILSATNKYVTTEENLSLALYPEIMPIATTLRSVRWEIIEGEDLATISSTGILTAKNPNRGGTVTVQATTIDGTNITATRTITIAAIGEVAPEPEPETTYTVTFYDWNNAVLKTQTVQQGQSATAPANPTREGYTFSGWDKAFTNVQSNLTVTAVYTQNSVEPDPGTGELTYTTQFNAGANGWIDGAVWHNQTEKIAIYTSPLYRAQGGKVTKLRITVNRTKGNTKYFCLSELELYDANGTKIALTASNITSNADHNALNPTAPDGGGFAALFDGQTSTYFHSAWKNMPAEDHYLEITLPNGGYDAFSFKMLSRARTIENNGIVYDQSHTFPGVMVMNTAIELVVGNTPEPEPEPEPTYTVTFYDWDNTVLKTQTVVKGQSATAPAAPTREGYTFTGWDKSFTNVQANLSVKAVYTQNSVEPDPQPELDNEMLYHVAQPHHEHGATAWVVAKGGSRLQSIIELGIASDKQDARQQFMFISNDGGKTRYLYHPAEKKYVNKDGSLSATPKDAVYFKSGAYANTFVVYFDNAHFVNVDQYRALLINDWGPGGRIGVADGGNSCQITAVGKYDITDIDFLRGEGIRRVQKVLENGEMFILLPDGSKYTMTGVRVK